MGNVVNGLLFQPPVPTYEADPSLIWLKTRLNERIPCFFMNRNAHLTILFSHGNAEDLGMILQYFEDLLPFINCNVMAYDYTGYGNASGSPREEAVYADIEACYVYLRDVLGIPWQQVVLFGRSLGTAATTHLASLTPVRGLILECPMLSVYRIAVNSRFTLPGDMLTNVDRIALSEAPTLVIHGTDDEIVPFWHGVELCASLKHPVSPYWVQGGDHNNVEVVNSTEFIKRISAFLEYLEVTPVEPALMNQPVSI